MRTSVAGVAILFFVSATAFGQEPPVPTLDFVRAAYTEAATSIHTFDYRMRFVWDRSERLSSSQGESSIVASEIRFTRRAGRMAKEELSETVQGPVMEQWNGFDGERYSRWSRHLNTEDQRHWLPNGTLQLKRDPFFIEDLSIDYLTGASLRRRVFPLKRILQRPDVKVVGWDAIDGHNCLKIEIPKHPRYLHQQDRYVMNTTVWLDPAESYLPRKIREAYEQTAEEHRPQVITTRTIRFARMRGEDDREYTLPVEGELVMEGLVKKSITVRDIVVNGVVSDDVFQPKFPDLCQVTEELEEQPRRTYVVGDANTRNQRLAELRERQQELLQKALERNPLPTPEQTRARINDVPVVFEYPRDLTVRGFSGGEAKLLFEVKVRENADDEPWLVGFTASRPEVRAEVIRSEIERTLAPRVERLYHCSVSGPISKTRGEVTGVELQLQGRTTPSQSPPVLRFEFEHRIRNHVFPEAIVIPDDEKTEYPIRRIVTVLGDTAAPPAFLIDALPDSVSTEMQTDTNRRAVTLTLMIHRRPSGGFEIALRAASNLEPEITIPVVVGRR